MQSGSTAGFRDFHHLLMQIFEQKMKDRLVWSVVFIIVSVFFLLTTARCKQRCNFFRGILDLKLRPIFSIHLVLMKTVQTD